MDPHLSDVVVGMRRQIAIPFELLFHPDCKREEGKSGGRGEGTGEEGYEWVFPCEGHWLHSPLTEALEELIVVAVVERVDVLLQLGEVVQNLQNVCAVDDLGGQLKQ